jgi:hypothetical protein
MKFVPLLILLASTILILAITFLEQWFISMFIQIQVVLFTLVGSLY